MERDLFGSVGRVAVVDDAESLLLTYGFDAHESGDLQAGRRWFDAAYREAELTGNVEVMAKAALGLGGLWVHEHRTAALAGLLHARLTHVLPLVDPTSDLALRLRARLAGEADYRTGDHTAILAVLDQARLSRDPVVRAEALSIAHHCLLGPDHTEHRRALADELVGEGARTGRRNDLLMGLLWQVVDLFLNADPHAERRLRELRGLLAAENHLAIDYVMHAIEVMLMIRSGQFDRAEQLAAECFELGAQAGDVDANAWYGAQIVAIRWYQGRVAELVPTLIELADSPELSEVDNSFLAALAVAAAITGDLRTAERTMAALRGHDLAELPRSSSWLVTMYGIVEASHAMSNDKAAVRAYELLLPFRHLPMAASLGVACFGSVQHALGVAALTFGDLDLAVSHLREAVHRNLALGHWPAVVASRRRYAEALARRGEPADHAAAVEQHTLAEEVAAALGVAPPAGVIERSPAPSTAAVCVRQGRAWRIEVGRRSVRIDHSVGMLHLAVLTANPGVEIAAVELAGGVSNLGQVEGANGLSAQPLLDRAAIQRYRTRLAELREEIDDLESTGDSAGATRAQTERDWVLAELAAGTGLGGRPRSFSDNDERARLAVGKAIRRAIGHVEKADAFIGAHLRAGVHTGMRCSYRPA